MPNKRIQSSICPNSEMHSRGRRQLLLSVLHWKPKKRLIPTFFIYSDIVKKKQFVSKNNVYDEINGIIFQKSNNYI